MQGPPLRPDAAAATARRIAAAGVVLAGAVTAAPSLAAQCALAAPNAALITTVEIRRGNVFDTADGTAWWQRLGNTLHRVTRPGIIERELLLDSCAPFDSARAAETERNLRALGTFRRVEVDTVHGDSGVVLRVETRDGWSTRPELSFSSTGEQTTFSIGLTEENFLGRAALFGVRYSSDPDRRQTSLRFTQRRVVGNVGVQLAVEDRTDGWNASAAASKPFFSYETRTAAGATLYGFDGQVRRYRHGFREPAEILQRHYTWAEAEAARALSASPRGFWRVGGLLQLTSDAYAPVGETAERRTVGTGAVWIEASRARFVEVDQFRSMGRDEDVDLSPRGRLTLLAAPDALGYQRGGIGLAVSGRAGLQIGRGFLAAEAGANGLFTGSGADSGRVVASSTLFLRPTGDVALLVHGRGGRQENPAPGEEFDLGFGHGLRAHRAHAFTGNRVALVVAEARWTPVRELFGLVHVGFAAVGAAGGAWWDGEGERFGSELGGGLRIGPSRLAGGTIGRMDLMWRFATDREPAGWTVVLGEGLTF